TLSSWDKSKPIVIFSHNPLYEYYPPWNFWVRDWREVHEVLRPYSNVTNIHGHTHQVLYNEIGKLRSIGMLATSWPWPYAPEAVPALTKCMVRADPGDFFDGVGYSRLTINAASKIEHDSVTLRKDTFAAGADRRPALPRRRCHGEEAERPALPDRHGVRDVSSVRVGQPSARVSQVPGADRPVRHAP